MFVKNLLHEIKLLSRNYWFVSLALILTVLCVYAGLNGLNQYDKRSTNLEQASANQKEKVARVEEIANALAKGEEHPKAYRMSPMNYSMATGSLAIMPAEDLSKLAIGQSDLYTHQVNISSREDVVSMSFNELKNPVQLLFGNFDLSFVLTYLIPLLIIAFTYNLKSQEIESGRFRLLASNPINLNMWLLQRYITRFLALTLIVTAVLAGTVTFIGVEINFKLIQFFMLTYAYMAFWFALAYLMNVLGRSSAQNAVTLLSLWILLVLIVPTVINQAANTIYPIPSRVALLNEIRSTKKELSEKQDQVLDEYLRNHPELIRNEKQNAYGYWQGFFASQEMTENTLKPLLSNFDQQLEKQQKWVSSWSILSPAVVYQKETTSLAETSSAHYDAFKNQIKNFNLEWRAYFLPFIFNNETLKKADLASVPAFSFKTASISKSSFTGIAMLLLMAGLLSSIGALYRKKQQSIMIP